MSEIIRLSKNKLKIVVIDSVYDVLPGNKLVKNIFSSIVELKLEGYLCRHSHGVLPLDTTDFICSHILLCHESEDNLLPVMGSKSITQLNCLEYGISYPLLNLLQDSNAYEHFEYIKTQAKDYFEKGLNLAYESSFTISPKIENYNEYKAYLYEVLTTMLFLFHREKNTDGFFGLSIPQFGTDKLFKKWGYRPVESLGHFKLHSLKGIEVELCKHIEWSDYAKKVSENHKSLWDNRLHFSAIKSKKVAA